MKIKKQLEILSSALPFNIGKKGRVFFLLLCLSSVHSSENKFVDQAIFRLSGQVYFLSQIKIKQAAIKTLNCASTGLLLSSFLGQDFLELTKVKWGTEVLSEAFVKKEILPYILLEKLKINSLSSGKEKLSMSELHDLGKKCTKMNWNKLNTEQKALFLSEVYLRDRFRSRTRNKESLSEFKNNLNKKEKHEILEMDLSDSMKNALKKLSDDS